MSNFFTNLFLIENYSSMGAPAFLWIALLILFKVSYEAGKGKFNPVKSVFPLSNEVNKELNLNWWQICTLFIGLYIIRALLEGISYKEVAILFSSMSIYIAIFGLYTINNANIDNINIESLKSKFNNKNKSLEKAIKEIEKLMALTRKTLLGLLVLNIIIMISSLLLDINWLWIISHILLFISFACQSMVILIDKLVIKD